MAEARAVQHAGHAHNLFMRQARELAQRPDHRIKRVGDADDECVGRVRLDPFTDRLHHLQVDAQQVVAAHARLARHAGGHDAHVGARDVGIVAGALEAAVEALGRTRLRKVKRLALRRALGDVEQDDVAQFLDGGEMRQRAADLTGADQGNLGTSH